MKKSIENANPIIVADAEWAKTIPDWMYKEIQAERMINGICELMGNKKLDHKDSVGDCEALVWLMTASSKAPLGAPFTKITIYLIAKVMLKTKRIKSEKDLFDFLKDDYKSGLTDYEQQQLDDLKYKIFNSRGGKIKHPVLGFLKEFKKVAMKKAST